MFLYATLGLPVRGGHTLNKYCVTVYGSILMRFSTLFSECIALSDALKISFSSLDGATFFAKLQSKIAKSPKIGGKVCVYHFV